MKARHRAHALFVAVAVLVGLIALPGTSVAACTTDELKPVFHDVTINQGLGSYLPLVRGKQTIVRFYLSQPQCASSTEMIQVESATLTVAGGGQSAQFNADNLSTPATLVLFDQGPAANGPGDPLFIVPGTALDPAGTDAFTASFSVTLNYQVVNGTKIVTDNLSTTIDAFGDGSSITAAVQGPTLPLKVLSVPMGTKNPLINNTSPQFSTSAAADAAGGFATLARMYPVRDTAGDLTRQGHGVRYSLNTGALLDVSDAFTVGDPPTRQFCGSDVEFTLYVQPRLYAYLHEYNTKQLAGSSAIADRVMGFVDQVLNSGCASGWAGVGSPESWVSTSYDLKDSEGNVTRDIQNRIGSVMGMEIAHNAGSVPCGINSACIGAGLDRDNDNDPTHSASTNADSSAPLRAYNTITGAYLDGASNPPVNRTVMKSQTKGWESDVTLFELPDWNLILCNLGGPLTPDCGLYPQTGASAGASTPTFGVSGTTNGTPAGTSVVESFVALDRPVRDEPGSPLTIVQRDSAGAEVASNSVPVRSVASVHDEHEGHDHTHDLGPNVYFFASVPADENTASYDLVWSDGTVLYEREVNRAPTFEVYLVSTPDDPIPTNGTTIGFDDEDVDVGTAITDRYNAAGSVATDVSFSSTAGTPRISGSCDGIDLEDLQEAVGALETPPCRVGTTTSQPFSLRNNQSVAADPLTSALVAMFDQPQSFVRAATGNGTPGTTATLTATLSDGSTISSDPEGVGINVSSNTAVEIDTGVNNIVSVALTYSSPAAEEIDDLVFSRVGSTIPEETTVIARVTDDKPDMKMTWFAECAHQSLPLEVAADPDFIPTQDPDGLYRALFTFEPSEQLTCASDSGASGAVISARVNDGVQTDTADNSDDPFPQANHAPIAVIADPDRGAAILENQGLTLYGQGVDPDEGVLPRANMTWELFDANGDKIDANGLMPGMDVVGADLFRVQPPVGGWPVAPGEVTTFNVRLTVVDTVGDSDTTETSINVLKDEDNDLIPAIVEPCFDGSDNNPLDALGDSDGDGLFNFEDADPCNAGTNFKASIVDVDPDTLSLGSNGVFSVTIGINGDINTVDLSSIRVSKLGGKPVEGISAIRTSIEQGLLVVKFDRQDLTDFFVANPGFIDNDVAFSIAGNGNAVDADGNPFTYSWEGTDWIHVQS